MSDELTPEQKEYVKQLQEQIMGILEQIKEEEGVDVPVDVSLQEEEEGNE